MHTMGSLTAPLLALALALPVSAQTRPPSPPTTPPGGTESPMSTSPGSTSPSTPPSEVGGKTLSQWVAELKHSDPSVRETAIKAMPHFGTAAADVVPQILDRLHDGDACPRVRAVVILRMVHIDGKDVPKVVAALNTRLLEEPQAVIRYEAAVTLMRFGDDSRDALPGLLQCVGDRATYALRQACVAAIKQAGRDNKGVPVRDATQALLKAMHDPAQEVRLEAATALGQMGRPAEPLLGQVLKELQAARNDRDKVVQIWSQVSLMALDKVNDNGLGFLIKHLKHPETEVRINAIQALGTIGPKAKSAAPNLLEVLSDKEVGVVVLVCQALVALGDGSPKVMNALTELSENKKAEEPIQKAAARAAELLKNPPRSDKEKDREKKDK
jgi:HEAT repeat protein